MKRNMLRNLCWLSLTSRFLSNGQKVHTPVPISVHPFITCASNSTNSSSTSSSLVPTGTLPPLPNEHEYTRRKFKIAGQTVQIYKRGNGEHAVFVITGALGIMRTHVLPVVEFLDMNKYTIYSWDQPGYGESTPPFRDTTNDSLHSDYKVLPSILKDLGHVEYSILGFSTGAVTALMLTRDHPELVRKVLVWGAIMELDEEQIDSSQKFCDIDSWGQSEMSVEKKVAFIAVFGEEYYRRHFAHWGEMLAETGKKHGAKSFAEQLQSVKCPVCFVHGGKDPMVLPKQLDLFQKYVKHAEVITIPNAKHTPQFETPSELLTIINGFLEKK